MSRIIKNYPLDILLCLITSLLLIPLIFFNFESSLRLLFGLPFILFIPGYILVFALFPARKTDRGIDSLERLVLSFGLSIAIVPLIGLLLNYTPWGIRLEPILFSLLIFIISIALIGVYRWRKTNPKERFIYTLKIPLMKKEHPVDRALTIILGILIIIVLASLIYVIVLPKTGETFTEFYLLGLTGKAGDYPQNLTIEENATVIIGVANHEHRLINYTIEIWLINQTTMTNNETIYHQMWYLDTLTTNTLPHQSVNTEDPWHPQWTSNYSIYVNTTGTFKLVFLLFTAPTEHYSTSINYREIADQKISHAYRETHLWITIE